MQGLSFLRRGALRTLAGVTAVSLFAATLPAALAAPIELADQPLFSSTMVPGNLLLALSVEYPTANTPAYFSTSVYATSQTYLGYFDPAKCYEYIYNSGTPSDSYFSPHGAATNRACSSTASRPLWSGNYMNWASTQTLDAFRWVLTGGNRDVDDAGLTILEKTFHSGQDNGSYAPNKALASTLAPGATPFNYGLNTRIWGAGVRMFVTGNGSLAGASPTVTNYVSQSSAASNNSGNQAQVGTVYAVYVRVKVCDTAKGLETNCVMYGSNAKPEGLMQEYSSKLRYSAFGYLNDGNIFRDGGVMRAPMRFIGPTKPVPGGTPLVNSQTEWNSTTGQMVRNPNPDDATATTSASNAAGYQVNITQSGVMNYLNKFGYTANTYKTYDPVSELYYAALRYIRKMPNVSSYSRLNAGNAATMATWLDGFPAITDWPVTTPDKNAPTASDHYMADWCEKNFILGIGDVNTHRDANLNGSTLRSGNEPAVPPEVTADTAINVKTATDMVGRLEGIANLGSAYIDNGRQDPYYMAGLAYHAHTSDLRSDLPGVQTVNTYWLDVLEGQAYVNNNVYYLATKYGGFTVPKDFSTYAGGNGTTTLTADMWRNNNDVVGANLRPDNYYTANNPAVMKAGLTAAFAKINSELTESTSTAYVTASPNESSSGASYAAGYNPKTWSGDLRASSVTYRLSDGRPEITLAWQAGGLLDARTAARKIVTCCTTGNAAFPFTTAGFGDGSNLHARTYVAGFRNVTGVAAAAQNTGLYINYLRGDRTYEQPVAATTDVPNPPVYRQRASRLGDIVNSKVLAVGPPAEPLYDATNPGYSSFKRTRASRDTVLYVGANDGMLHAFKGGLTGTGAGQELFAYIPSFLYGNATTATTDGLANLGSPSYAHRYYVDATPQAFDIDFNKTYQSSVSTPDWRSVLVGGLGKGGKGYYAIDVSNPADWTSETAVAGKVLWEFTHARMGHSYGDARAVKLAKYGWVLIFSSGYNNSDGKGYIFIVNPKTGALLEDPIATPEGDTTNPINMAYLTAYVPDETDYTAEYIYGADLRGNIWRMDVRGTATGSFAAPVKIARATDALGVGQPITAPIRVAVDPTTNKRYVFAGTGRLLDETDITSSQRQSFYAFVDGTKTTPFTDATLPTGVTYPVTRASLNANVNTLLGIGSAPVSSMGWYLDLNVSTSLVSERITISPVYLNGVVAAAISLPYGDACTPSGTSRTIAVGMGTGQTVLRNDAGDLIASSGAIAGVITDLAWKNIDGKVRLIGGSDAGAVSNIPGSFTSSGALKRLNWREVLTAD